MSASELRVIASGPDLRTVFEKVRALIEAQSLSGAMCGAEAVGAHWAIDTAEALEAIDAKRVAPGDCRFSDDIHDLTVGAVRGG